MKSSLKNMVLVLFTITLIASAGVGAVDMITEEPIAAAKAKAVQDALKQVLPAFDTTDDAEQTIDGLTIKTYKALAAGETVGYAVETATKEGFGGVVRLMVGFDADGRILNINVLEQSETPGLGTKMCDEGNPLITSFKGKKPAEMTLKVRKDGGDIDALTAATISSRAYTDAVARAYKAFEHANGIESETGDSYTGATQRTKKGGNDGE